MPLIDSHCHLYFDQLNRELPNVLERARTMGVDRMICIGIDLDTSRQAVAIAEEQDSVVATAGIHPHEAQSAPDDYQDQLVDLLTFPQVKAVGEIGLDYYRNHSDPDVQKRVFREQLELAKTHNYPVVFHNREADKDIIDLLKSSGINQGVAHCFSSDLETADSFLEMGLYISFAGNLTFKNSHLPDVAKAIPLDRILVETDSPFLSPVPFRGKPNEPGRTRFVAEKLAEIKQLSLEEVTDQTRRNTEELFIL